MKEFSDAELVQKIVEGENIALNEIMSRYKARIHSFIYRYVNNEDTAYDLTQETFTKLYFAANSFNQNYKFSSWLFQIALNLCHDYNRKKRLLNFFSINNDEADYEIEDISQNPEKDALSSQAVANINMAINSLPHKLKTALILFALEDNSQDECAKLLGTTAKTIETRVYRARKILSRKLKANF